MNDSKSSEHAQRGKWRSLRIGFDAAAERLPEALRTEGFGVITQIDLQQTFMAKLGTAFRRYRIFGACNPTFALKAVETDPRAGLLLPCNVVLFERDDGRAELGIIDPVQQLNAPSGQLADLAHENRYAPRACRAGRGRRWTLGRRRRKMLRIMLFALGGAALGFGYQRLIGCRSGACVITSTPYVSTLYGALMGFLVSGGL